MRFNSTKRKVADSIRIEHNHIHHMETEPTSSLPSSEQPSNALAIWALVMGILCCAPVGIVLGIIGLNKYKQGSNGWIMSLIGLIIGAASIVLNVVFTAVNPEFQETLELIQSQM